MTPDFVSNTNVMGCWCSRHAPPRTHLLHIIPKRPLDAMLLPYSPTRQDRTRRIFEGVPLDATLDECLSWPDVLWNWLDMRICAEDRVEVPPEVFQLALDALVKWHATRGRLLE